MLLFYDLSKYCILKASSIFLSLVVWKLKTKQKPPKTLPNNPAILFRKKKKKEHDFVS